MSASKSALFSQSEVLPTLHTGCSCSHDGLGIYAKGNIFTELAATHGKPDRLSEEGSCATSSLHAEVWPPGEHCSMLMGTVHNYLLLAAGKTGASAAPDTLDVLFLSPPFSTSAKHLISSSEMDLHRLAMTPMPSYACLIKWTSKAALLLMSSFSCFATQLHAIGRSSRCKHGFTGQWLQGGTSAPGDKEHPGTPYPISTPHVCVFHPFYTC